MFVSVDYPEIIALQCNGLTVVVTYRTRDDLVTEAIIHASRDQERPRPREHPVLCTQSAQLLLLISSKQHSTTVRLPHQLKKMG